MILLPNKANPMASTILVLPVPLEPLIMFSPSLKSLRIVIIYRIFTTNELNEFCNGYMQLLLKSYIS